MRNALIATVTSILCAAGVAEAGPEPPEPTYSFNGIASLSGCSGSVFRMEGQSMDDFALVLTNGHCISLLDEFEVIVEEPTNRTVELFDSADANIGSYRASEIVYATMHKTDMAILRLEVTYQELADDVNVDALMLATGPGNPGEDMVIVSGLWEYVAACQLDGFVFSMQEDIYQWWDSLRFTEECVTFGGTSGSPVISVTTGQIIGVNNTGYEGGAACSLNNPCEVDEMGNVTTIADGSYGQQTYWLYGCVDDSFGLDLNRDGCELPRPSGVLGQPGVGVSADAECDQDGNLDSGETAILTIDVTNDGPVDLVDTTVTVTSPSDSVEILTDAPIEVGDVPANGSASADVSLSLAEDVTGIQTIQLDIVVASPNSTTPEVALTRMLTVNFDDLPNSSTIDTVESANVPWAIDTVGGGTGDQWTRERTDADNTVWRGVDIDENGDQRLESPALEVGDGDFVVSFTHRYKFEFSGGTYWDGGVVEISTDDGGTWRDAAEFAADVGYDGVLTASSGNPLADRNAFADESPAWPDTSEASIDFGTQFAGETVKLRFRLGTDAAAGAFGWEIDDISVDGIDNLPFSTVQADTCGDDPMDPPDMPDDPMDPMDPMDPPDVPDDPMDPPDMPGGNNDGDSDADCGCATAAGDSPGGWLVALLVLGVLTRRRRRSPH